MDHLHPTGRGVSFQLRNLSLYNVRQGVCINVHPEVRYRQLLHLVMPPLVGECVECDVPITYGGVLYKHRTFGLDRRCELQDALPVTYIGPLRIVEFVNSWGGKLLFFSRISTCQWVKYRLIVKHDPRTGATWASPQPSFALFCFLTHRKLLNKIVTLFFLGFCCSFFFARAIAMCVFFFGFFPFSSFFFEFLFFAV